MVVVVTDDHTPIAIKNNAKRTVELSCAVSKAADASNKSPVIVPQHLHTMVASISYNKVAQAIEVNAPGIRELAVALTLDPAADGAQMQTVRVT